MNYKDSTTETNNIIQERYGLAIERIEAIGTDEKTVDQQFRDYFVKTARFILFMDQVGKMVEDKTMDNLNSDQLKDLNHKLYEDILADNYEQSYGNPAYAKEVLGEELGGLLCFLYTEIRGMIVYAYEQRKMDMTIVMELFIEVYNGFEEDEQPKQRKIQRMIYWFLSDYCDLTLDYRVAQQLNPQLDFITSIVMNSDLSSEAYLYSYGEYISPIEREIAHYLNQEKSQEDIENMAKTMVDGYINGFKVMGLDISKKKTVNIRFNVGFERVVREAVLQFRAQGLDVIMYRYSVQGISKGANKIGVMSVGANPQYDFDHRQDQALFLDKALVERKLAVLKVAYEKYKQMAKVYGGPAVMEIFGEQPFEPKVKPQCQTLSETQKKLTADYANRSTEIMDAYVDLTTTSFTIIAYPVPGAKEMKENFSSIFDQVIKLNTLDSEKYVTIQQQMIDILDDAKYVHIVGADSNQTDLKVALCDLENKEKQTRFENCVADVNIPLGEVFTSPKLQGTTGILHVSGAYLHGLYYDNLRLEFEDGVITEYSCHNFDDMAQNKAYIENNLLMNHKTLPMGEFAIGTNTVAYAMAKKYNILHLMPILIVEKTGPHFAVGDTCYSRNEDHPMYNQNGKEVIARENDYSLKRLTEPEKAYFNCHTDITIPYDEIGKITAVGTSLGDVNIIENGRFAPDTCQILNEALSE